MACSGLDAWLQTRLDAKKAEVVALDAAITALQSGSQSYTFNSGQTQQSVTRANLATLIASRAQLENDIVNLSNRLCGGATLIARPGF